jgi:signal peptidase II
VKTIPYRLAGVVVVLDQLSKAWALHQLSDHRIIPLVPGLVQQRLVFNTGAAFSLLSGNSLWLGLVSALVAVGLVGWIQTAGSLRRLQGWGLGLLLGGAIGNGLDRWRLGQVVDFLDLIPVSFPVFNLADVAINLAVLCLVLDGLREHAARPR